MPDNLERSSDYRRRYFERHKGLFGVLFWCPYCGKLMWNKKKIQVDHIRAVHRVRQSWWLRRRYRKMKDGVNDISNLVAACAPCNRSKGAKGGKWVFLGFYGHLFMPFVRLAGYAVSAWIAWRFVIPGLRELPILWEWASYLIQVFRN